MSTRLAYASDLTDALWALIEPLLPAGPQPGEAGRPREVDLRDILHVRRTGCQRNALPHSRAVYWYHHHVAGVRHARPETGVIGPR